MRILMTTPYFSPSLGGMETVAECLANEFVGLGHDVVVATSTAEDDGIQRPFTVLRAPSLLTLIKESLRADAVLQSQISLRLGLPSLFLRRPTVIAHHMWTPRTGPGAFVGRIKHALLPLADNVAVSKAMAKSLSVPCSVIPNPYQTEIFHGASHAGPKRDLVFLGRLIEGKGGATSSIPLLCSPTEEVAPPSPSSATDQQKAYTGNKWRNSDWRTKWSSPAHCVARRSATDLRRINC